MSTAVAYYLTTLLVYAGVDMMACWALNLQYGVTGLLNVAFILFQAAGAYTAAVLALPPDTANGGFQQYILGFGLPFPITVIGAGIAGGLLALIIGLISLRKLRSDYEAVVMLVVSIMATTVVSNAIPIFNGSAGVSLVPNPLDGLGVDPLLESWLYVGLVAVVALVTFLFVQRIVNSPFGRSLRSVRENEAAAAAVGKDVARLRLLMFVVGGVIAAASGGMLVGFIGLWAPSAWLYPETLVVFAAVIIGGRGNNFGAAVGALLVPVAFNEATRFLPQIGNPVLVDALQWIVIAVLILAFLWFRPQGIVPERRRIFARSTERPSRGAG
ncbi:MAG: branched-chain amino acid ABC transporter permease [Chloroflexi bacterium]|nr:branched-chain amino acid ABC transporter permease [Chloroflexota bacterium]